MVCPWIKKIFCCLRKCSEDEGSNITVSVKVNCCERKNFKIQTQGDVQCVIHELHKAISKVDLTPEETPSYIAV